ncbi:MAG: hypothetical protein QM739_17950 [Propionivibrio sp.]
MNTRCTAEDRRDADLSEKAAKARFIQILLNDDPLEIDEWAWTVMRSTAYRNRCDVGDVITALMNKGELESPYPETVMVSAGEDQIEMPRWTVMELEAIAYDAGTTVNAVLMGMVEGMACEAVSLH